MDTSDEWTWPHRPANEAEFDAMMASLDRHLAARGAKPHQRGITAASRLCMTFGFTVPLIGGSGFRGEPFGPSDLVERVYEWYSANFGELNKVDPSPGSTVLWLHGTYRRIKIPLLYGGFNVTIDRDLNSGVQDGVYAGRAPPINVLRLVDDMTQVYANRLEDTDLEFIWREVLTGYEAVKLLDTLSGHEFFDQARGDYEHSVEALLAGHHLSKARWDNAQCAEKVLKGLLDKAGHKYPTYGAKGHDILELGRLANQKLGLSIPDGCLRSIHCPTSVRYGEMNVDQNEAYCAHKDLLAMLRNIAATLEPTP